MRIRAGVALVGLVAALTAGCGSDEVSTMTLSTTTSAITAISTLTITTTAPIPSTTAVTTTTVPPWTTMPSAPEPVPTSLFTDSGDVVITSICVSAETTGALRDSQVIGAMLSEMFGVLGVEVVADGCDASLRLVADGQRRSATYQDWGTCWTGQRVQGSITVEVGGVEQVRWSIDDPGTPENPATSCPARDDLIVWPWPQELVAVAFAEAFGPVGEMASGMVFNTNRVRSGPPSREEIQVMQSMLSTSDDDEIDRVADWVQEYGPDARGFRPLVPYLIGLLNRANNGLVSIALKRIVGDDFGRDPEQAWKWWNG